VIPAWCSAYIGQPYSQANCWEFVRQVYNDMFAIPVRRLASEVDMRDWFIVRTPEAGDVLVFERGKERHVGIALDKRLMMHASKEVGAVVIEPYTTAAWVDQWKWACRHKTLR